MHTVMSPATAPLPTFARAAAFAALAIAAVGTIELWHHGAAEASGPALATVDATQPLAPAPMSVDMWHL